MRITLLHLLSSVSYGLLNMTAIALAQTEPKINIRKETPPLPPDEIIQKFAAKEAEFRKARDKYTYRQTVKMEVLEQDGRRTGEEYFVLSDILFDDRGRRLEKVLKAPPSTLQRILLTPEDLNDIQNIYPFVLTTDSIGKYNLTYLGKEKIDEIDCYVFDVTPKHIEGEERFFEGKIWVDDRTCKLSKRLGRRSIKSPEKPASSASLALKPIAVMSTGNTGSLSTRRLTMCCTFLMETMSAFAKW